MNGENSHSKGPNARAELTSLLYLSRTLFQPLGLKIVAAAPDRSGGPGAQGRRAHGDDDAYRQGIECELYWKLQRWPVKKYPRLAIPAVSNNELVFRSTQGIRQC